jgi:hypothetical protein
VGLTGLTGVLKAGAGYLQEPPLGIRAVKFKYVLRLQGCALSHFTTPGHLRAALHFKTLRQLINDFTAVRLFIAASSAGSLSRFA